MNGEVDACARSVRGKQKGQEGQKFSFAFFFPSCPFCFPLHNYSGRPLAHVEKFLAETNRPANDGWPVRLSGSITLDGFAYAAIENRACVKAWRVPPAVRADALERSRAREEAMIAAPARAPGDFHATAVIAARRFVVVNCLATAMIAARRFVAVSCRASVEVRLGESREAEPIREAVRAARFADAQADRSVAEIHPISFHCAKAIRHAPACCVHFCFHRCGRPCVQTNCCLRPLNAASAR